MDKQIKERGITFNAEMVRAILDGRKTQTRRVIDWRRATRATDIAERDDGSKWPWSEDCENGGDYWHDCPFGKVGDRLYVRETFQGPLIPEGEISDFNDANPDKFYSHNYCKFAADGGSRPEYLDADDNIRYGWRSSSQMPRWASRITLEITDVRVERLHNISREDACAEGIRQGIRRIHPDEDDELIYCNYLAKNLNDASWWFDSPIDSFLSLWESIYGPESWQHGPWVWVVEFKRVEAA